MSKISLSTVSSGFLSNTTMTLNFTTIQDEFQNKVLYRNNPVGEPNSMMVDLDMDSHRILNLPEPLSDNEPARLKDVQNALAGATNANLISYTPSGTISSTNVQAAINEIVSDLAAPTGSTLIGDNSGGALWTTVKGAIQYFFANSVFNKLYASATGGTDGRGVDLNFNTTKGALRYGGSDVLPTNDERGYWNGFTSKNAWGDAGNIGLYSTAFNRNGLSYAPYSNTFGHDCISMGTASIAGGAGTATGDDADPFNVGYLFNGYCSIAWGKNNIARGEKSYTFGEENKANSRSSGAMGYDNITGKGLTSHLTNTGGAGTASDGVGALAQGHSCSAYGDGAYASGHYVTSYNGSQTIGSGINFSSRLENRIPNAVGMGANVVKPTFLTLPGDGTTNHKGKSASRSDYHILLDVNTTLDVESAIFGASITNGGSGGYAQISLQALRAGALTPMFEIEPITKNPKFFGNSVNFGTSRTIATATTAGNQGEVCWDSSFIYVCIATNTWKRVAIATW